MDLDQWHGLLTNRYVCEGCLTRFFTRYDQCPACHRWGRVTALYPSLYAIAQNDEQLRDLIAGGQRVPTEIVAPSPWAGAKTQTPAFDYEI